MWLSKLTPEQSVLKKLAVIARNAGYHFITNPIDKAMALTRCELCSQRVLFDDGEVWWLQHEHTENEPHVNEPENIKYGHAACLDASFSKELGVYAKMRREEVEDNKRFADLDPDMYPQDYDPEAEASLIPVPGLRKATFGEFLDEELPVIRTWYMGFHKRFPNWADETATEEELARVVNDISRGR